MKRAIELGGKKCDLPFCINTHDRSGITWITDSVHRQICELDSLDLAYVVCDLLNKAYPVEENE